MSTLTFKVSSKNTAAILEGVSIVITDGEAETTLTTDVNGTATYTPTNSSIAYATAIDGYKSASSTVEVSGDAEIDIELETDSTDENTADTSTEDTTDENTNSTITTTTTSEDVSSYKALEAELKAALSDVESSIKTEIIATVQTASTTLISKAKTKLTESIAYYVEQRSKLDLSEASNWDDWLRYTSMIGGLYILRADIQSILGKALSWLETKIKSL